MPVRVFTLEEANRLLPEVEEAIRWLQQTVSQIVQAQDRISVLDVLGAAERSSPEHEDLLATRRTLEELLGGYNEKLNEVQRIGCVLKDINHGVVDFYGLKDGRLIFLCWRMGEKAIDYWHEVTTGMMGRRPVSEL